MAGHQYHISVFLQTADLPSPRAEEIKQKKHTKVKDGSTESIYEPARSHKLKEVLPKHQCSPSLRRQKTEWGGSDPSINSDRPHSAIKVKRNNRRSYVPNSPWDNETLGKDQSHACWMSSGDKRYLCHRMEVQSRELCEASSQNRTSTKETNSDETHAPAQGGDTAVVSESIHNTGRLKKLQNLVQTKRGLQSEGGKGKSTAENNDHLANVLSNNNPVLSCIGLGKRTEKKPSETDTSPQAKEVQDSEEEDVWSPRLGNYLWSPFECPQPWTPFYHTCQQPRHELWVCGGTLTLPQRTEWDHFESLIQELDGKQPDLSLLKTCSITDLKLSQNTQKQEQIGDPTTGRLQGREMETSSQADRMHINVSPEETLTAITTGNKQRNEEERREVGGGRPVSAGHQRSCNSLVSLCSLNSGQSSSSGVTSGSDCSSNRDSLRLEDDLLCTRQFCGRARVHTDFVPSPYDTESLKLKVGDVIDIIAKPPMGIWTGKLGGKIGNFKFIYVDVLTDTPEETQTHRPREKSTVQEVLRRLSLEEYTSSLQLNGYQTVDDLMKLREHHLTELNVTDPEHRLRLLAAVDSLQQLCSDSQLEKEANQEDETPSESMKADMTNCPRDSGCHMPSDSPDNSTEDTDLPE